MQSLMWILATASHHGESRLEQPLQDSYALKSENHNQAGIDCEVYRCVLRAQDALGRDLRVEKFIDLRIRREIL